MIYQDVYNYLMRKSSGKEFDIILNMLNYSDWGSILRVDVETLAKKANTTKKYVREVISKFTNIHKDKRVIKEVTEKGEKEYKLLIGKSNIFYNKGDKYCQKYGYFYSDEFMGLSIYEKRILLTASMEFSTTNQNTTYLRVSDFIFRNEISSGLLPSKKVLLESLHKINEKMDGKIKVGLVSNCLTKEELIYVSVSDTSLNESKSNYTERFYLREALFRHGFSGYLKDEYCIEIEKVGNHLFKSFVERVKNIKNIESDLTNDVLYLARDIYNKSIGKLAKVLSRLIKETKDEGEISAYFSSIVFTVTMDELAKYDNQYEGVELLFKNLRGDFNKKEITKTRGIVTILKDWCHSWTDKRFKRDVRNKSRNDKRIKYNNKLKEFIIKQLTPIEEKDKKWRNKNREGKSYVSTFKSILIDHIELQNNRMMSFI